MRGRNTAFYRTVQKHRKIATILTRTITIDPATGVPTISEIKWTGPLGFVQANQMPRNDQIVVTDAWVLTDQPLEDKSEIHVAGMAYTVLKLTILDSYNVAALKAVAPAEVHVAFRGDQEHTGGPAEVPPDQIWVAIHDNHEPIDQMSGSLA